MIIFIKRFLRRLKHTFRFSEMWAWHNESCRRCGSIYRIFYDIDEEVWLKINGQSGGCLCLDCFITIAQDKKMFPTIEVVESIKTLAVFQPGGRAFYLLNPSFKYIVK